MSDEPKYPYSKQSKDLLEKVDADLWEIFTEAANLMNITILPSTIRTHDQQREYVRTGKSKTMNSKHLLNVMGYSEAVDAAPYPVDWRFEKELHNEILGITDDQFVEIVNGEVIIDKTYYKDIENILHNIERWYEFIGIIKGIAYMLDIDIRMGADFKGWKDMPHVELNEKE